jgi:hypothetical protein
MSTSVQEATMLSISNISQNIASRKIVNNQVFYNECNTNAPKSLNSFEKRDLMAEQACELLANKPASVYMVFDFFMRKSNSLRGISWYSVKTIAKYVRKSEATVKRATKILHRLDLIHKTQRGEMKSNLYKINYDLIKPPCEPPITFEGSTCAPQSIRSFYNNSNCNNLEVKKMNDSIKKNETPNDIIDPDTFYPSGTALEFLNKIADHMNTEFYVKELRARLKEEQRFEAKPLQRFEANFKTFAILKKTKELWSKHKEGYIPAATRQSHNDKPARPTKVAKTFHRESHVPESCKPIDNPIEYGEMKELLDNYFKSIN